MEVWIMERENTSHGLPSAPPLFLEAPGPEDPLEML